MNVLPPRSESVASNEEPDAPRPPLCAHQRCISDVGTWVEGLCDDCAMFVNDEDEAGEIRYECQGCVSSVREAREKLEGCQCSICVTDRQISERKRAAGIPEPEVKISWGPPAMKPDQKQK